MAVRPVVHCLFAPYVTQLWYYATASCVCACEFLVDCSVHVCDARDTLLLWQSPCTLVDKLILLANKIGHLESMSGELQSTYL